MKQETIRESEGIEVPTVINDKEPGPMSDLEMTDRTMPFLRSLTLKCCVWRE